jgi:hypothetical protein
MENEMNEIERMNKARLLVEDALLDPSEDIAKLQIEALLLTQQALVEVVRELRNR